MFRFFFLLFSASVSSVETIKKMFVHCGLRPIFRDSSKFELLVAFDLFYLLFCCGADCSNRANSMSMSSLAHVNTLWRLHHDFTLLPWQSSILYIPTMIKYTNTKQHEEINKNFGYCCNNEHKACNINIYAVNDVASILLLASCLSVFLLFVRRFTVLVSPASYFDISKNHPNQFGFTCVIYLWQ